MGIADGMGLSRHWLRVLLGRGYGCWGVVRGLAGWVWGVGRGVRLLRELGRGIGRTGIAGGVGVSRCCLGVLLGWGYRGWSIVRGLARRIRGVALGLSVGGGLCDCDSRGLGNVAAESWREAGGIISVDVGVCTSAGNGDVGEAVIDELAVGTLGVDVHEDASGGEAL